MADIKDGSGWRLRNTIFLLTGLLVALAVIVCIALTLLQGRQVADRTVNEALNRSYVIQQDFQQVRYRELELITRIFTEDPDFVAYLSQATGNDIFGEETTGIDEESLVDQIRESRDELGYDLVVLLDTEGKLLAHSERPVNPNESIADHPLLITAIEDLVPVTGLWRHSGDLYQTAIVPLDDNVSLVGFLIAGLLVDDELAEELKSLSGTEVIWASGSEVIASTFPSAETEQVLTALQQNPNLLAGGMPETDKARQREIMIQNSSWIASVTALSPGGDESAAMVSLMSLDRLLANHQRLLSAMVIGGLITVALALIASFAFASRLSKPMSRLADIASAATGGDYDQTFEMGGAHEVNQLRQAFSKLLGELREKREMEEYVADLSRYLPDPATTDRAQAYEIRPTQTSRREDLVIIGIEFKHEAQQDQSSTEESIKIYEQAASWLVSIGNQVQAKLEFFEGQRVILTISGEQQANRALKFVMSFKALQKLPRASIVIVAGQVDHAVIRADGRTHRLVVGRAMAQVDLLLEECRTEQVLISPNIQKSMEEVLSRYALKTSITKGRLSARNYHALDESVMEIGIQQTSQRQLASQVGIGHAERARKQGRLLTQGDIFGDRFEIASVLGHGGMGRVYKAFDRELEDFVALKMLLPEIADNQKYLDQLKEEIRLARRITHSNVLRTYDFGMDGTTAYISMEYVRGMTLRYLLRIKDRLPFSAGLRIARQLSAGLTVAHRQGVVHRDIKPENIILEANGNAKLMDFGVAGPTRLHGQSIDGGLFIGTPRYAAPEQMEGQQVDASADIFSCGVLMYEVFVGRTLFAAPDNTAIYNMKTNQEFEDPQAANPNLPEAMANIIRLCLKPVASDRFNSAAELSRALRQIGS